MFKLLGFVIAAEFLCVGCCMLALAVIVFVTPAAPFAFKIVFGVLMSVWAVVTGAFAVAIARDSWLC